MVSQIPLPIAQIVYQHHERMGGSGYPQALSGKDILLEARIMAVADEVRSIFYASSKSKAIEFFEALKTAREKDLPSAVKCLENSLFSCLTYLQFPQEEWVCLRTTNVIERVN